MNEIIKCHPSRLSIFGLKGDFLDPRAHDWRIAMPETTSNQLPIYLRIRHVRRIPNVYGRDNQKVTKEAQKDLG